MRVCLVQAPVKGLTDKDKSMAKVVLIDRYVYIYTLNFSSLLPSNLYFLVSDFIFLSKSLLLTFLLIKVVSIPVGVPKGWVKCHTNEIKNTQRKVIIVFL